MFAMKMKIYNNHPFMISNNPGSPFYQWIKYMYRAPLTFESSVLQQTVNQVLIKASPLD